MPLLISQYPPAMYRNFDIFHLCLQNKTWRSARINLSLNYCQTGHTLNFIIPFYSNQATAHYTTNTRAYPLLEIFYTKYVK